MVAFASPALEVLLVAVLCWHAALDAAVSVDAPNARMQFIKRPQNETKSAQSTIRLQCDVRILDNLIKESHIEFLWFVNSSEISVTKLSNVADTSSSLASSEFEIKSSWKESAHRVVASTRLLIRNSQPRDSGFYSCVALYNGTQQLNAKAFVSILEQTKDVKTILEPMCQLYNGSMCTQFFVNKFVFIEPGFTQNGIEEQLQNTFNVISQSKDISNNCRKFVLPGLCYIAFPECLNVQFITDFEKHRNLSVWNENVNIRNRMPIRRICIDDCEFLENDLCSKEYAIAIRHPVIGQTLKMDECGSLPKKTDQNYHYCVPLGIDSLTEVKADENCYWGAGVGYRGTKNDSFGKSCLPWRSVYHMSVSDFMELAGGHNFCRNPDGLLSQPFCFVDSTTKQICDIPSCSITIITYAATGFVSMLAVIVIFVLITFFKKICARSKQPIGRNIEAVTLPLADSNIYKTNVGSEQSAKKLLNQIDEIESKAHSGRVTLSQSLAQFSYKELDLIQEIGEGAFGLVYRGQLKKCQTSGTSSTTNSCSTATVVGTGSGTIAVAVKTLKKGADSKMRADFHKEMQLIASLQHPNVVSLVGVIVKHEPICMIFEFMAEGDLHEFLIKYSTKDDDTESTNSSQVTLSTGQLLHIATQIACGMEYLAENHYIHRDLATRNCLVAGNLVVKISDFGLSRDMYRCDYYRVQSKSLLPVRWMPPEAILYGKFTAESDVWSFGVVLWEIFSFGLQPYYGYNNQEVISMIRNRQLLSIPDNCPNFVYALMIECWTENSKRRPTFAEIVQRLRLWKQQIVSMHFSSDKTLYSSRAPSMKSDDDTMDKRSLLTNNL